MSARRVGPTLNDDTSEAIAAAVVDELCAVGYGRLTIDAVARRASVGKAAVYRRFADKEALVVATLADVGVDAVEAPDVGSLRDDVTALLRLGWAQLGDPTVARVLPDLLAETARDSSFGAAVHERIGIARRGRAAVVLDRAVQRGELRADVDRGLALDLLAAPLYWRLAVTREPFDEADLQRLVDVVLAGLRAA